MLSRVRACVYVLSEVTQTRMSSGPGNIGCKLNDRRTGRQAVGNHRIAVTDHVIRFNPPCCLAIPLITNSNHDFKHSPPPPPHTPLSPSLYTTTVV